MKLSSMLRGLGLTGLGAAERLAQLREGWTAAQARALLGPPAHEQALPDGCVWHYNLHAFHQGWLPCLLVFDGDGRLRGWGVDQARHQARQAFWVGLTAVAATTLNRPPAGGDAGNSTEAGLIVNEAWRRSGAGDWSSR